MTSRVENPKRIISLYIEEYDDRCNITLESGRKVTTFKIKGISEAFEKVKELIYE